MQQCTGGCFKNYTIHHVYRALETLSLGRAGGEPPAPEAVARLRQLLSRERKDSSLGLLPYLRDRSKHRRRNQMLCDMSYEAAWGRMLQLWDLEPFEFTFSAGGGGGDPGGGGPPPAAEEVLPPAAPWQLDIRTRTFEVAAVMAAVAERQELNRRGKRLSTWHEVGGSLPMEVLLLIDAEVRVVPCPRARREETAELQAIRLREQIDEQRRKMESLEAEARAHELTALRAQRALEAEREQAVVQRSAAAELAREECVQLSAQLKEQRLAAAAKQRELLREMQSARIASDEHITKLQVEITGLERQVLRATAALRATNKEREAALANAEQELQRLSEGRIWARVRDEEAKSKKAAAEASAALAEVAHLTAQMNRRSSKVRFPASSALAQPASEPCFVCHRKLPRGTSSTTCATASRSWRRRWRPTTPAPTSSSRRWSR